MGSHPAGLAPANAARPEREPPRQVGVDQVAGHIMPPSL